MINGQFGGRVSGKGNGKFVGRLIVRVVVRLLISPVVRSVIRFGPKKVMFRCDGTRGERAKRHTQEMDIHMARSGLRLRPNMRMTSTFFPSFATHPSLLTAVACSRESWTQPAGTPSRTLSPRDRLLRSLVRFGAPRGGL